MTERRFDTLAVHAGEEPDLTTGALDPPVVLSSAFAFADAEDAAARFSGSRAGPIYTRWRNPTVDALEQKIAALEGAEACVALGSGMAAVHASIAALASAGGHVVAPRGLYAETARLLRGHFARFGVETTYVSPTKAEEWQRAVRGNTRLFFLETPSNPLTEVSDIAALSAIAKKAGAMLIVDQGT